MTQRIASESGKSKSRVSVLTKPNHHVMNRMKLNVEEDESPNSPRQCHRRGCNEPATFVVLERYQEETGHGAVEAEPSYVQSIPPKRVLQTLMSPVLTTYFVSSLLRRQLARTQRN